MFQMIALGSMKDKISELITEQEQKFGPQSPRPLTTRPAGPRPLPSNPNAVDEQSRARGEDLIDDPAVATQLTPSAPELGPSGAVTGNEQNLLDFVSGSLGNLFDSIGQRAQQEFDNWKNPPEGKPTDRQVMLDQLGQKYAGLRNPTRPNI